MSYKALYRTYRPRTFDEVAGQQHIVKTLKNALTTKKIAHAYLFSGPRGTGKTTMAKLFAKALNCEQGIGNECCQCKNCLAVLNGSHPDVIEIDAASNNGVEQVRSLIENVRYSTMLGKYKVFIIDEVHMMSGGAFNALLKTLEEPPENVVFILATTEPHKILPTVLSRCQRYDFTKLSDDEIEGRLKIVFEKENVQYEEEAVKLIVSLSDGGMRDALSISDQVLAYSNNEIKLDSVLSIFSLESKQEKIDLVNAIVNQNVSLVIEKIRNYISKGTDIARLTEDLLGFFKDMIIYKTTRNGTLLTSLNNAEVQKYLPLKEAQINNAIDLLSDANRNYRFVSSRGSLFEITLLKICLLFKNEEEKETPKVIEDDEVIFTPVEEKKEIPKVEITKPDIDDIKEDNLDNKIIYPENIITNEEGYSLDSASIMDLILISKKDLKTQLNTEWNNLSKFINHPIHGNAARLLSEGHLIVVSNTSILLEFDFIKPVKKINNLEMQKEIQKVTQIAFNKKYFVYALQRTESVEAYNNFTNAKIAGKLKRIEDVNIVWKED